MSAAAGARKATGAKTARGRTKADDDVEGGQEPPNGQLTDGDQQWLDRHRNLDGEQTPAAQAETLVEDIPDGAIAVPVGPDGHIVHVMPRNRWPSSALTALHEGNLEYWASKCLHKPDYDNIWVGLDPVVEEVQEMLAAWTRLTGDDVGKAPVLRGSLRNGKSR